MILHLTINFTLKTVTQKKFKMMIMKKLNFVQAMTSNKYYLAHTKAIERGEQRNCLNG